jgi:hypothetical protein
MEYLERNHARPLVLGAKNNGLLMWYVDALFCGASKCAWAYRWRFDNEERVFHNSINKTKAKYKEFN